MVLCLGSIFFADKYHKKIESSFILTFLFTIITIYIASFIGLLEASVGGVAILWTILGIRTLGKHRKADDHFFKRQVATTGFFVFTILFFGLLTVSFSKILTSWDQYANWSILAKKAFYTNNWIADIGMQYPPIPVALQYFFMKMGGEYRQGIELFALQMLTFSCLLPLLEWTAEKKIPKIAVTIILLCMPAIFSMLNFYDSSYPDTFMGILLGFIMATYWLEENKKYQKVSICLSFAILTLTKATGMVIAIIAIVMLVLYEIFSQKKKQTFRKILTGSKVRLCMVFLLIVLVTYLSWKGYQTFYAGEIEQASTQQIRENKGNIFSYMWNSFTIAFLGVGNENAIEGAKSLGTLLTNMSQNIAITKPMYVNMISTIFLLLGIAIVLYVKYSKKDKFKWAIVVLNIGLVLYILSLQLAYWLVFSTEEMIGHNGLDRYLPTFFLGMIYFILSYMLKEAKGRKEKNVFYVILACAVVLVTPVENIASNTITSGIHEIEKKADWQEVAKQADVLKEKLEQSQVTEVWLFSGIQNGGDVLYENFIRYDIYPQIEAKSVNAYKQPELEDAMQRLNQEEDSYIYIWNADEQLEECLGTELESKTLYERVKQTDESYVWKKIE